MAARSYAPCLDGSHRTRLAAHATGDTAGLDKDKGLAQIAKLGDELAELTNLMVYAGQNGLLVILQGPDASGKDGAIREILAHANLQTALVQPFKVPTEEELSHDFLWRVHRAVPAKGHMVLFNRSHYEDVLAARVHKLVPKSVWKGRYEHINDFERLLIESGTIVVKFCLHVSPKEQRERLLAREKDPKTAWKLNPGDWREIPLWDEFQRAYEDVLDKCASPALPWYLVPADKKWFRNLAIVERLVLTLRPYRQPWLATLKELGQGRLKEIRAIRASLDAPQERKVEKQKS